MWAGLWRGLWRNSEDSSCQRVVCAGGLTATRARGLMAVVMAGGPATEADTGGA